MSQSATNRGPDSPPVVFLQGLEMRFGRHQALRGLDATLGGRCIGLLGPNGAGKTTLLHILLGFYTPTAGRAEVLGHDIRSEIDTVRSLLGYMPEREALVGKMSAVHFVRMMGELSGLPRRAALERAHEALFHVGLGEARYRPLESYSYGMRQLAKLAQALVHGPRLLLLDEPTAGLDPPARDRMLELIREIRDAGEVRLILSSHLLRDVEECCDEVLVLRNGELAAYCDLEAERRGNQRLLEVETRGDAQGALAPLLSAAGCEVAVTGPERLKLVLGDQFEVQDLYRLAAERQIQLRRVTPKRDSLEDIFLRAMDGKLVPSSASPISNPAGTAGEAHNGSL